MRATPLKAFAAVLLVGAGAARAAEPIKIGALFAVTGPASFLGAPEARTLQMLVDEANAKGGVAGHKVELIIKDTGASPEKAVSFAKQLIDEQKVLAILGPSTSGESMAIKNLAEEKKALLISCAAAEAIVQPVAKHVFTTPQKDRFAVLKIFEQMKKMNLKRVAVLSSNTGFGKAGKDLIEKLAPEQGFQIVASEVYDKAATDLTAEVTKIKSANADALINWSIEPAQAIVIKNARQIGLAMPIFQSHGFGNVGYAKAAGAAAEGVMFPAGRLVVVDSLPPTHPQKAVLAAYKRDYESKYKEDVSTFGGHAYDAWLMFSTALRQAGTTDAEKIRSAVENLKGLVGTGGVYNLSPTDHNGLDIDAFEMLTVKDGRFVPLASVSQHASK